jgi:hypothetical protein
MIVENQLDRRAGWIGGIKKLEEFDELPAAVVISDEGMNLPGEQIDPGQQVERTMAFVLMITREGRVDAGYRRQIGRGCRGGLDSRFFVMSVLSTPPDSTVWPSGENATEFTPPAGFPKVRSRRPVRTSQSLSPSSLSEIAKRPSDENATEVRPDVRPLS